MIKTLRKKFILINMLLVSIVLVAVFSVFCVVNYRRLERESARVVEMVLNRKDDQKQPRYEVGQAPPADFMRDPVFVVHVNNSGEINLIMSENVSISEVKLGQIVAEAKASGQDSGVLRENHLLYFKKYEPDGLRIAFIDVSGNTASISMIVLYSVLLCLSALAAFFLISLFLSRWALRPVEQAWRQQRQFVADASHELKTPLTVILANTGILKSNRADTIERQIGWVENTEAEAKRMKKLVDSLLFLAKTDDAKTPVVHSKINFSDVVLGAALAFESVAYERGIAIDTGRISPDVYILGDEAQLGQLSGILLDNAVKYSDDGGTVTLSLTARQEKAVFTVHNAGAHLGEGDLGRVFDRFYRADKSRSNEGYGLGLSIAKSIAESHNGKISAESSGEKGTDFIVVLGGIEN